MRTHFSPAGPRARLLAVAIAALLTVACGDDDGSPTSPSGATASLTIENFTATVTPGAGGTYNYRASLRLRETGGAAATVTGVTLTLTQASGVTVSRDVTPADAFPAAVVAANSTLDSSTLSVNNAPVQATQLAVRITFTGANGATNSTEATTTVVQG